MSFTQHVPFFLLLLDNQPALNLPSTPEVLGVQLTPLVPLLSFPFPDTFQHHL